MTWAAAYLPLTHVATPQESNRHKALKERIARTAPQHGTDRTYRQKHGPRTGG
ncbi:hypothetical protein ACFRNJ_38465 [Streptomyces sp. NPDC056721]|uniref:hypothetical protein n=1 Tax=Streptomyces sp. NPDC056721 TaxID=3345923 RepID=UPI003677F2A6